MGGCIKCGRLDGGAVTASEGTPFREPRRAVPRALTFATTCDAFATAFLIVSGSPVAIAALSSCSAVEISMLNPSRAVQSVSWVDSRFDSERACCATHQIPYARNSLFLFLFKSVAWPCR